MRLQKNVLSSTRNLHPCPIKSYTEGTHKQQTHPRTPKIRKTEPCPTPPAKMDKNGKISPFLCEGPKKALPKAKALRMS